MAKLFMRFIINLFNMSVLVFIAWLIMQVIIETIIVLWKWAYSGLDIRIYLSMGFSMGIVFAIVKTIKDYKHQKKVQGNKLTVNNTFGRK